LVTEMLDALTKAVSGNAAAAILASAAWGILSVVLSPCHLASIPLIIAFIGEQRSLTHRRACQLALIFASGILATTALIGIATAALGRMLGDLGPHVNQGVAALFFVIGLHFLGIVPLPFSAVSPRPGSRRGPLAALVIGLVFGLALGPCTFAYMAPMLGITLSVARTNVGYGIVLLVVYGLGHAGVIVAAGTFTEVAERYLKWTAASSGLTLVRKVCGALVIAGGLYVLLTSL
jgi:cytochrome c-type biogenesis protein